MVRRKFTNRNCFTSTYPPQINGQTEWNNLMILAILRCYGSGYKREWDEYVQILIYTYKS